MTPQDQHDLDKLTRWRDGLASGEGYSPAYAVFLVTENDRDAHDVFRYYRSKFEELGASYHHLVIFGQHGTSSTSTALLSGFGFSSEDVPLLGLVPGGAAASVYTLALPKGENGGGPEQPQPSNEALERISEASRLQVDPDLKGIGGLSQGVMKAGTLTSLVEVVFAAVSVLEAG